MKRMCDYLDCDKVRVIQKDGRAFTGVPISVDYADESLSGFDELNIENQEGILGFIENDIADIIELA